MYLREEIVRLVAGCVSPRRGPVGRIASINEAFGHDIERTAKVTFSLSVFWALRFYSIPLASQVFGPL